MKKICILVFDISQYGGAERVGVNLANEFCEIYKVFLISVFNRDKVNAYSVSPLVETIYLVKGDVRLRYCYIKTCRKLNAILRRINPDITMLINSSTYPFLPALWNIHTKCIACEHTNLKNRFHTSSVLSKIERRYSILRCDKIVTLTTTDQYNYIEKYHISEKKVTSIYNWIAPELFSNFKIRDGQARKIITVGRFDQVKGYEMLVEVAKQVLKEFSGWEWHIYGGGDGAYKEKIRQMIAERELEDRLILKSPVNMIYEKYAEYSFLVLTSYYEGLPMVLLEAKACGLPVVAFSCPTGPDEIVTDGIDGYLIPCYDIVKMAEKIKDLMKDPMRIEKMSRKSHENIEKFEKNQILGEWKMLFENLLEEGNS